MTFYYNSITDCQYFYICIAGQARRNGCQTGQVFNKETLACDSQLSVKNDPVCRSWYNDTFMENIQVTQRPGGIPIDTSNRQRVVVRRRKPATQQVQQQVHLSCQKIT